jgi:hypothetical protein
MPKPEGLGKFDPRHDARERLRGRTGSATTFIDPLEQAQTLKIFTSSGRHGARYAPNLGVTIPANASNSGA